MGQCWSGATGKYGDYSQLQSRCLLKSIKIQDLKKKKTTDQIPLTSHWFVTKDFFKRRGSAPIVQLVNIKSKMKS